MVGGVYVFFFCSMVFLREWEVKYYGYYAALCAARLTGQAPARARSQLSNERTENKCTV